MVTTNSTNIEEVRDLFRRAIGLAKDLVGDLDAAESELHQRAIELFQLAVTAVIPVLKYVDEEVTLSKAVFDPQEFRGVLLARELYLIRDGNLVKERYPAPKPLGDLCFFGTADEIVDEVLDHLTELAKIFNIALRKMDQRRESIKARSEQLDEAIAPFQRDSSS